MEFGLAYDPRCLKHDNGSMILDPEISEWLNVGHAENADRVHRALEVLVASEVVKDFVTVPTRAATRDELALVHTPGHIDRVALTDGADPIQVVGPEARAGANTWEAASISAGSALSAVDFVLASPDRRAYVLTRPPGHHATADEAMGFCLFNNAAIAARHAQREHGLERIAILDWDVHHGNGTQDVFYDDPDVLFVSIHQDGLYPEDQGTLAERGSGAGEGTTVNVPMPAGSGDAGYVEAVTKVAIPALEDFQPQMVILSSGQDAAASDPLGRMSVTTEGFREMTRLLVEFADASCAGRIVALQEGGYSLDHMPFCVLATIEALAGLEPSFTSDPIELDVPTSISEAEISAVRRASEAASGR
ncbi:MAG: class II histone deacetylase [Solirubrobacterales bacterium]